MNGVGDLELVKPYLSTLVGPLHREVKNNEGKNETQLTKHN